MRTAMQAAAERSGLTQSPLPQVDRRYKDPRTVPVSIIDTNRVAMFSERLAAWDLDVVKRYAVQKGFYSADKVDDVEREYKRYIALAYAYPNASTPISKAIDDFWHTHILFTQDYTAMCKAIGGYYLHHRPSILDEAQMLEDRFRDTTFQLYRASFGEPDPNFWNVAVCCCGYCDSDQGDGTIKPT